MTGTLGSSFRQLLADAGLYQRMDSHRDAAKGRSLLMTLLASRGLWVLEAHRIAHYSRCKRERHSAAWWLARLITPIGEYLSVVGAKSEFLPDCQFDHDIYLSNGGYLICGAQSIGAGSVIHDHCTLGANGKPGRPTIGRNVWIGSHCVLAGTLTVGDGATILPGSFLTFSVRPGALVAGNPAQVIAETFDNTHLRSSSTAKVDVPG